MYRNYLVKYAERIDFVHTYLSVNTIYLTTSRSYTETKSPYSSSTLTISYSKTYAYTTKLTTTNTNTNTNSLTYYTTDTLYSTITRSLLPSPTIVKTIFNNKIEFNINLVIIKINSWLL
jgi:carbohydrate-binding DOMON domain-containing protein